MERKDSLIDVIRILYKRLRVIIIVTMVAFIGSIVFSLLLDNYYRSTTLFYAASSDLLTPEKLFGGSNRELEYYGSRDDIDRILTISRSNEVTEYLINQFDLYEHYEVDSTKPKAHYKLKNHLFDLYEINITKYDAIELSVEDKDPELAAEMANAARQYIDKVATGMIRNSLSDLISTFEHSIEKKEVELTQVADSLRHYRELYGIHDPESQAETYSSLAMSAESQLIKDRKKMEVLKESPGIPRDSIAFLRARIQGLEAQLSGLTDDDSESKYSIKRFNKGKAIVEKLQNQFTVISSQLAWDNNRLRQIEATNASQGKAIILVEKAEVPEVKSRPKRSILVIAATVIGFVFACMGVLIFESYKRINWNSVFNA